MPLSLTPSTSVSLTHSCYPHSMPATASSRSQQSSQITVSSRLGQGAGGFLRSPTPQPNSLFQSPVQGLRSTSPNPCPGALALLQSFSLFSSFLPEGAPSWARPTPPPVPSPRPDTCSEAGSRAAAAAAAAIPGATGASCPAPAPAARIVRAGSPPSARAAGERTARIRAHLAGAGL